MVNTGYFDVPFALDGDLTVVPDTIQGSGAVSYPEGFGVLYQTAVSSGGLNVPRTSMNQLFNDITTAIQLQQQGLPAPFITSTMNGGSPYSYAEYATVILSGVAYTSNVGSNTDTPPSSKWKQVTLGNGLPLNAITGTGHDYVTGDASTFIERSNSGTPMVDTLPGTSGALTNGWLGYVKNTDATTTCTIEVGGGGTINIENTSGNIVIYPGNTWFIQSSGSGVYNAMRISVPNVVPTTINGLLPTAISGSNTTAAITVSSGIASNSTNEVLLSGAGYSWAVSNGNAALGYYGSTTLPDSSTIHVALCQGSSGTTVFADTQFSVRAPAGYVTYQRHIFSFNTDVSGNPIPYTVSEVEGGAMQADYASVIQDVNVSTMTTTSRTLYTLTVPQGIEVRPKGYIGNETNSAVVVSSPSEPDIAPSPTTTTTATAPLDIENASACTAGVRLSTSLLTNTSGQIGARAFSTSTAFGIQTYGYIDFRRV